jgi:hypothetical protein
VSETSTPSSSILGGLAQIGKYFQLISIVPAALVVGSLYMLIAAGAPGREPSWKAMAHGISSISLQGAIALALAIVIVGMTLHPFQLAATQFLEGYWGPSSLGRTAMLSRAWIHLNRKNHYLGQRAIARRSLAQSREALAKTSTPNSEFPRLRIEALRARLDSVAFNTAVNRYPTEPHRIMPTNLGNMLRRHEDLAGKPLGRPALDVVPRLMYLAPPEHSAYVDDARTELDLAVRFVISWLLVTVISFALVWPYGAWIAVPIGAYALAWLSYRAAVHTAEEYGRTLIVLVDLNHRLLDGID